MHARVQALEWEEQLCAEGEPVLLCRSRVPVLSLLEERSQKRINRFYAHVQSRFQRWCRRILFQKAEKQRQIARAASKPFDPLEVHLDFEAIPEEDDTALTVRLTMSSNPELPCVQQTQCWDLSTGFLCGKERLSKPCACDKMEIP